MYNFNTFQPTGSYFHNHIRILSPTPLANLIILCIYVQNRRFCLKNILIIKKKQYFWSPSPWQHAYGQENQKKQFFFAK